MYMSDFITNVSFSDSTSEKKTLVKKGLSLHQHKAMCKHLNKNASFSSLECVISNTGTVFKICSALIQSA